MQLPPTLPMLRLRVPSSDVLPPPSTATTLESSVHASSTPPGGPALCLAQAFYTSTLAFGVHVP